MFLIITIKQNTHPGKNSNKHRSLIYLQHPLFFFLIDQATSYKKKSVISIFTHPNLTESDDTHHTHIFSSSSHHHNTPLRPPPPPQQQQHYHHLPKLLFSHRPTPSSTRRQPFSGSETSHKEIWGIRELAFSSTSVDVWCVSTLYEWWFSESTMSMNLLSDSDDLCLRFNRKSSGSKKFVLVWVEEKSHHLMRDMAISLINTVAFLHWEIYHRDIKPDNILIGDRGEITLEVPRDEYISRHGLFGTTGQSEKEETARYTTRVSMVLPMRSSPWRVCGVRHLCRSSLRIRLTTFTTDTMRGHRATCWNHIGTPHALTDPTFENALISLCLFDSYDEISWLGLF